MEKRGQWASNIGFILAAAGSAVGLGNIWKFPGKIGTNGGGTFILVYLIVVCVVGFTVMLAEIALGRHTQKNIVGTFKQIDKRYTFIGGLGVVTAFIIMSYYSVVGGWVLKYIIAYLTGANFGESHADYFVHFVSNPVQPILWHILFMLMCVIIIVRGVTAGIEKISKILMPLLLIILIAIAIRSVTLDGSSEGLKFMFDFDINNLTADTVAVAIGQAFFSLSLGMSIMITYGSYVPKTENIVKSTALICAIDTIVALIAAVAIIPAVFATGIDLGMGGGFAFTALPGVFDKIPGGFIFGFLFFVLLFFAAFTSAISIMEGTVAFVTEELKISRMHATIGLGIFATLLGCGYSLSQGAIDIVLPWFDFKNGLVLEPMGNVMEKFTDNLALPLGAFLTCLFVGFVWKTKNAVAEIEQDGKFKFGLKSIWSISVKFICPVALLIILFYTMFLGIGMS